MADVHKSLRLGDLLVEKGLITQLQLREAIEIQQTLQSQRFGNKNVNVKTELGEILIELGYISRHQLKANLNWQRRLKATTAVMVFIAPLLTAACGGGGGGSASASASPNTGKVDYPSSIASNAKPDLGSDSPSDQPNSTGLSTFPGAAPGAAAPPSTVSPSSSSSANVGISPIISSSSSNANVGVSSSSSSSVSSAASSSSSSAVDGSVQLLWNVPSQRENGDYLDITEIGGYELRYRIKGETEYQSIRINDGFTDAYYFSYLKGEYEFQIATFDKEGRFSSFVDIIPS